MAASAIPAVSAIRTASGVGTETATSSGAPIAAAICTISTESRLVSSRQRIPAGGLAGFGAA